MASNLMIGFSQMNSREASARAYYRDEWEDYRGGAIEDELLRDLVVEDRVNSELGTIIEEGEESLFSFDFKGREDIVYVVIGDERVSMDALVWTINNAIVSPSSALVFLVYVFPPTKFIPSPLGKLPINLVNPEQKDMYMAQQRRKRRNFLQKFVNVCSAFQVKVDTIVIESEMEAQAILDLIPILNVRKLVLGATKSVVRRMRSKKGNGVADQIVQSAPEYCEVKVICKGKEMSTELTTIKPSLSASKLAQDQQHAKKDSFACGCFKKFFYGTTQY